ncbi:MAG: CTP synthetase [Sphingomonadales bacterium]|nr:CTP synthetase [Sphingomonadales bacterium]
METKLALVLFAVIGTTLAGSIVTALLSINMDGGREILIGSITGFLLAAPISWLVARRMTHLIG